MPAVSPYGALSHRMFALFCQMGKVIKDGVEIEVKDGDSIIPACEKLGLYMGCTEGNCWTCLVDVIEGGENLSERTEAEAALGVKSKERLVCQCRLKGGTVKLHWE